MLNLGSHPLCDELPLIGDTRIVQTHPQEILVCPICITGHQKYQIPKERLFPNNYHYRASLTQDVLDGMKNLVHDLFKISQPKPGAKVLDIGCNDGSLLKIFKESGLYTIGVEPTDAILDDNGDIDEPYQRFFDESISQEIKIKHGHVDFITLTNVFAHIEDLENLCKNIEALVGPNTVLAIENHYLGSIVNKNQFDTFYHEHPRTYSARSFEFISQKLGMQIVSISNPSRYGGNIRVFLSRNVAGTGREVKIDENDLLAGLNEMQKFYSGWKRDTKIAISDTFGKRKFGGKALPGRAVMLINSLGISHKQMPKLFEKPLSPKNGHWIPNTKIEIVSDDNLVKSAPDDLIIWAWHIEPEVIRYVRDLGYEGRLWSIMPELKLIKSESI